MSNKALHLQSYQTHFMRNNFCEENVYGQPGHLILPCHIQPTLPLPLSITYIKLFSVNDFKLQSIFLLPCTPPFLALFFCLSVSLFQHNELMSY